MSSDVSAECAKSSQQNLFSALLGRVEEWWEVKPASCETYFDLSLVAGSKCLYVRSVGEEAQIHKQQREFESFHNKRPSSGAHPSTIKSHLPSIVLA